MSNEQQIKSYYDENAERELERSKRHRMEFEISLRVICEKLPPPPAHLLDIGGGPGYYALRLAQAGYTVTLLDLSARNLAFAQKDAAAQNVSLNACIHGSALHLGTFADHSFDAVLLMGPLYHLLTTVERVQAVQEARRVLKPGGLIFAAFISRYAPFRDAVHRGACWVEEHPNWAEIVLQEGINHQEWGGFTEAYFEWPDAIAPFMEANGFATLQITGCEGVVASNEDYLATVDEAAWQTWFDLNYRLSSTPAILGASDHLLYCGCAI